MGFKRDGKAPGISDGRDGRISKRLSVRGKTAKDVRGAQTNSDAEVGKCKRKADGTETDREGEWEFCSTRMRRTKH